MVIRTNIHLFTMEVYNKTVSMTREVVQAEALKVAMQINSVWFRDINGCW